LKTEEFKEQFIQFIWKFQLIQGETHTCDGLKVKVINPGLPNPNEGPDFLEASIQIGDLLWNGSIEIHTKSSAWLLHNHNKNKNYTNVILHVVWENDKNIVSQNGEKIPTLELKNYVDEKIIERAKKLYETQEKNTLPCYFEIELVPKIKIQNTIHRALIERLEKKIQSIIHNHSLKANDWEEITYFLLLKSFGFKINEEAFIALANFLPYKIVKKHILDRDALEALFYGVGGFLNEKHDDYQAKLFDLYQYLKGKYNLFEIPYLWKKLRTRPHNFPCIRIAQLVSVLYKSPNIFDKIVQITNLASFNEMINHPVTTYWHYHNDFSIKKRIYKHPKIGKESIRNLCINVVVPLKIYYGKWNKNDIMVNKGIELLESIPSEKNKIIKFLKQNGFPVKTASDSQGLIHLYQNYCLKKKCLNCSIGHHIIKQK
jgi:hypothetical protein